MGFVTAARPAARLPHACASSSQRRATQRAQIAAPRARQPLSSPGPRPSAPCPPCERPPLARPARPHRQEAASLRSCFSCCTVTCAFAYEQLRSPASASCQAPELNTGATHGVHDGHRKSERSSRAALHCACDERISSKSAVTQGEQLARPTGEQGGPTQAGGSGARGGLADQAHSVWASDHLQGRGPGRARGAPAAADQRRPTGTSRTGSAAGSRRRFCRRPPARAPARAALRSRPPPRRRRRCRRAGSQ